MCLKMNVYSDRPDNPSALGEDQTAVHGGQGAAARVAAGLLSVERPAIDGAAARHSARRTDGSWVTA